MKLVMIDKFRWQVEYMNTVMFGGSLENAARYLEHNLGVDPLEIAYGLKCLRASKDRGISFGVNRTFVCTFNKMAA